MKHMIATAALTLASEFSKFGEMINATLKVRRVFPYRRSKQGRRYARRLSLCRVQRPRAKRRERRERR